MTERILHFEDLQRIYAPDGPRPQVASVVRWLIGQAFATSTTGAAAYGQRWMR